MRARNGIQYAIDRMTAAEDADDFIAAVYWANALDRLNAAYAKRDAQREARKKKPPEA